MKLVVELTGSPTYPVDESELIGRLNLVLLSYGYQPFEITVRKEEE